jgi:preprotein translocase subunit SecB
MGDLKLTDRTVDYAAVGRVSSRAELRGIRLAELSAKCESRIGGTLEPSYEHTCTIANRNGNELEVACTYNFVVKSDQTQVLEAAIKYFLLYELNGTDPFADSDITEFAFANGTLHSWPFVRESIYALTSRMGYPPYTLPLFHFKAKPKEEKKEMKRVPPKQRNKPK